MKKFKFTLHSLLNVKLSLEKQQKTELAAAQARKDGFVRELAVMETRLAEQRAAYGVRGGPPVQPHDLAARDRGFKALFERMDEQREKIRVAEAERVRVQKKLADTMGERKMLEKLKEKQLEQYREEARREEAVVMDDYLSNQLN